MIARVFRAKALPGKEGELEQEIRQGSVSLVKDRKGLVTYYAGRPIGRTGDEFVMITIWKELATVKAFAGPDWEKAVISDRMAPLLDSRSLGHFEIFAEATL